jgi:nicotinamidase-related amidase
MAVATRIAVRDPLGDHLITSQISAMFLIDYQPSQIASVWSIDKDLLLKNIVSTTKLAKLFGVPIVHSTVTVATGRGRLTLPPLAELLEDEGTVLDDLLGAWVRR